MTNQILNRFLHYLHLDSASFVEKLIWSALIVLIIWAISTVMQRLKKRKLLGSRTIRKAQEMRNQGACLDEDGDEPSIHYTEEPLVAYYRWKKSAKYTTWFIIVICLVVIWLQLFNSMGTFLGLVSAGLAIALKDFLSNLAGFLYMFSFKPFKVGDRIQIGVLAGDVIDVRILSFTVLEIGNWAHPHQSTGRILHIPNSKIFVDPLFNYSMGFQYMWHEINVLVTFESDWQAAKAILMKIGESHDSSHFCQHKKQRMKEIARKFLIIYNKLEPNVYVAVKDSGILLTLRYLTTPRGCRHSEDQIWEDILLEFTKRNDIDFAYPTQRFFNNALEGKATLGTDKP